MANINKIKVSGTSYDIEDATARSGLNSKQDTLVSGTNIKTINSAVLLGSGNIQINLNECDNTTSAFITKAVSDLENYYDKNTMDGKLDTIPKFSIKVVDTLPTENISNTTVYLVKDINTSGNLYTEYIYVIPEGQVVGSWEKLGTQTVNLEGYATEQWVQDQTYDTVSSVNGKLELKANSSDLDLKLSKVGEQEKVYATDGLGNQTTLQYNTDAVGGGLARREQSGALKVGTPVDDADATTKTYVDTALASKQDTLISSGDTQNIKTVNNEDLLGTGNITVGGDDMVFSDTPVEGATPLSNIEAGGMNWSLGSSGGSSVVANPTTVPEDPTLTSISIDNTNYNLGGGGSGNDEYEWINIFTGTVYIEDAYGKREKTWTASKDVKMWAISLLDNEFFIFPDFPIDMKFTINTGITRSCYVNTSVKNKLTTRYKQSQVYFNHVYALCKKD